MGLTLRRSIGGFLRTVAREAEEQARAEDEEAEAARAKENAEPVDPPQKDKEQI